MKHIPILRTRRLTVQIKPISIGDAIKIAGMPEHLKEAENTVFLNAVIETVTNGPTNPLDWTIQERNVVIAHYLACSEDDPDFSLGEGRYSNYADWVFDYKPVYDIGNIKDDHWTMVNLTGFMAESIERIQGELGLSPYLHWLIGCMACQLVRKDENEPPIEQGAYDEWLLFRMRVFLEYQESDFEQLLAAFFFGNKELYHLLNMTIDQIRGGIAFLPKKESEGHLPPARFRGHSCISNTAINLAGKSRESSG